MKSKNILKNEEEEMFKCLAIEFENDSNQLKKQNKGPVKESVLIGLCYVDQNSLELTQKLKENVLKKIKNFKNGDIDWAKIFVVYITHRTN